MFFCQPLYAIEFPTDELNMHRHTKQLLRPLVILLTGMAFSWAVSCQEKAPEVEESAKQEAPPVTKTPSQRKAKVASAVPSDKVATQSLAEIEKLCKTSCANSAHLKCLSETGCFRQCQENFAAPICRDQFLEVLRCAADQPPESWSCPSGNAPQLKDGVCDKEQGAVFACLGAQRP